MHWKLICCFFLFYNISCKSKSTVATTEKQTKGGKAGAGKQGPQPPLRVDFFIAKTFPINQSIEVPGSLLPFEETEIHPEVAGKVVMLAIKEGAYASRGAVLAKLFDGDLQAQLKKLRIQLQINRKNQDRQSQLLKIGGLSQQDYDLSTLTASSTISDMQVLEANISKTIIRAPFSGKMGFKNISIGAYVTPATIVTTIRQVSQLKLDFSIPEKYSSKIALGKFISFTVEGNPKKYSAKIIATESSISETNRSLKVRALVGSVDNYLAPGAFANVNFDMGDNQSIMVPSQSIIPTARDKKIIVARNGAAAFQTVTTGIRDSVNVQILSGLAVGDTVVTTGILQLKPGSKILTGASRKNNPSAK
jgi:membrane fusion protein (multidrug efflux system)